MREATYRYCISNDGAFQLETILAETGGEAAMDDDETSRAAKTTRKGDLILDYAAYSRQPTILLSLYPADCPRTREPRLPIEMQMFVDQKRRYDNRIAIWRNGRRPFLIVNRLDAGVGTVHGSARQVGRLLCRIITRRAQPLLPHRSSSSIVHLISCRINFPWAGQSTRVRASLHCIPRVI